MNRLLLRIDINERYKTHLLLSKETEKQSVNIMVFTDKTHWDSIDWHIIRKSIANYTLFDTDRIKSILR